MNKDEIVQQIMNELQTKATSSAREATQQKANSEIITPSAGGIDLSCGGMTEFVGYNTYGSTVGFVIANVDPALHEQLKLDPKYRSIGIVSSRYGAAPHAILADEAVKSTNTELVKMQLSNDPMCNGGHGALFMLGAEDVSDARRAVEITIGDLETTFGGVATTSNSFYDIQWSARAGQVLAEFYYGEMGKAWGLINAAPAAMGLMCVDAALKAADVKITYATFPEDHTNEYFAVITGDSGAVRQAVRVARDIANKIMPAMGEQPKVAGKPYY